jgi:hypothetical protein
MRYKINEYLELEIPCEMLDFMKISDQKSERNKECLRAELEGFLFDLRNMKYPAKRSIDLRGVSG